MGIARRADGRIRGRYQTNIAATNIDAAQTSDALRFGIDEPRSAWGRIDRQIRYPEPPDAGSRTPM